MATVDAARDRGLQDYRKKLLEHKEVESRLKESKCTIHCWIAGSVPRLCATKWQVISMQLNTNQIIPIDSSARAIERIDKTIR